MMGAHGEDKSRICPWRLRLFADRKGVEAHAIAKHPRGFARTEEAIQRGQLQAYHQRKLRETRQ